MAKIAILCTTFLRDKLLFRTLQSYIDFPLNDSLLLVADQGYADKEKVTHLEYVSSEIPTKYFRLPFDCGISYARNFLINEANKLNIPFCLMLSDSLQFIQPYDFTTVIKFLESDEKNGLIGFLIENRKEPSEYLINITPKRIQFSYSDEYVLFEGKQYLRCDICSDLFLAKTTSLLNIYDPELKLAETEDMFITYKNKGYKVFWSNNYKFKSLNRTGDEEYQSYKNRTKDFQKAFRLKYDLSEEAIYPKEGKLREKRKN